ncbi:MAG: ECF-type sigma factor [Acidobacteriota bacterium]
MNEPSPTAELTHLLAAWSEGDEGAFDRASSMLYSELRQLARSHLRRESRNPLQTTELIHEAFLLLAGQRDVQWKNRRHFFGIASQMMRRILVDQARRVRYKKRGSGQRPLPLDDAPPLADDDAKEVLEVHEALEDLARLDPQRARIVEMRFFAGFEMDEISQALDLSVSTVYRQWRRARAWLHRHLAPP